jgi:WD40 repeat protein/tRNA A-37 threonylcarbamoyl transferase component Bud32
MAFAEDMQQPVTPGGNSVPDPAQAPTIAEPAIGATSPMRVRYFGEYELIEEVARGGMGVVYKARQSTLGRIVALKMILAGQLANDQQIQRFRLEAQAAARLDHPGIVPIYEIGEHEGHHYFTMAFVEGESLATRVAAGPLPPRLAAQFVRTISEAVDYAHQQGVVHRDLKPANVLVDRLGQPRVTDFGLAKQMQSDPGLTGTGQILGTPSYMPPEQASGQLDHVGPQSDVYALGAILYCLLTGRPPFQAATPLDTVLLVLGQDPVPVRQLNGQVPRDLETITQKCLEKDPQKRYSSARDLGRDLERWLNHEPIVARRSGPWERGRKWVRRQPAWAATIAISVLSLAGIIVAQAISNHRIRLEEQNTRAEHKHTLEEQQRTQEANKALTIQEAETRRALERLRNASYARDIGFAQSELEANNVDRAMQILNAAPLELRNWEWNYLEQLCHVERRSFSWNSTGVRALAYQPDGKQLAVGGGAVGFGPFVGNEELSIWSEAQAAQLTAFRPDKRRGAITGLAWSPDGGQLALSLWCLDDARDVLSTKGLPAESYGRIELWDVPQRRLIRSFVGHKSFVNGVALSRDGSLVASAGSDGIANVWETATGERQHELKGHRGQVMAVAFSPNGELLATAGQGPMDRWGSKTPADSGEVKLWDLSTGKETVSLRGHDTGVFTVAFSPDGTLLASAGRDRSIKLWGVRSGELLRALFGHEDDIHGLAFSPDGNHLASGSSDRTVRLWNPADGRQKKVFLGHVQPVMAVAFNADNHTIASCASAFRQPGEIKFWDTQQGLDVIECEQRSDKIRTLQIAPNGRFVAVDCDTAGDRSRELRVFDGQTGRGLFAWTGGWQKMPSDFWFSANGERLSFLETSSGLKVNSYNPATGKLDGSLALEATGIDPAVFTFQEHARSLDNSLLGARGSPNDDVFVWSLQSGKQLLRAPGAAAGGPKLLFSPDGRYLEIIGFQHGAEPNSNGPRIAVWEISSRTCVADFLASRLPNLPTLSTTSGRYVAVAGREKGTLTVWDVQGQAEVTLPDVPSVSPQALLFSRDGRRLWTTQQASRGTELKYWDVPDPGGRVPASGVPLRPSANNRGDAQLSPDGRRLFTCADGTLKVWDDEGQLLLTLRPALSPMQLCAEGTHVACAGPQGIVRIWRAAVSAR